MEKISERAAKSPMAAKSISCHKYLSTQKMRGAEYFHHTCCFCIKFPASKDFIFFYLIDRKNFDSNPTTVPAQRDQNVSEWSRTETVKALECV